MIGRWIDRAALMALGATALYLFFLNAGAGIPLSMASAFICAALGRYLYRYRPWRDRVTMNRARAGLHAIARMTDDEATAALRRLTGREDVLPMLRHPYEKLPAGAVFGLWRAHLGEEALTIVTTCPAAPEAIALVETLTGPKVTLIDSPVLIKAIRRTGLYAPPEPKPEPLRQRLRRFLRRFDRPASPRALLYGLSLMGMYLLTGQIPCLLGGLTVIGVTGTRLIRGM